MQHNLSIRPSGSVFTIALSLSWLGASAINPVFADSHAGASEALGYESALTDYRPLDGDGSTGWKESNDTVGRIGGWRSYANEAYQANQAEAAAKEEAAKPVQETFVEPAISTDNNIARKAESDSGTPGFTGKTPTTATSDAPGVQTAGVRPLSMTYQSTMTTYRPYEDNPPGDWRAANDRVGEIGGWRTYAKEAYEANKRKAQADAAAGNQQ